MPEMNPNALSGPVPGMGLTSELGSRPWQQPPEFTTLDETIPYYLSIISSRKFFDLYLDALEAGVAVTSLVDILVQTSVMEGKHNIDVGVLVSPILVEAFLALADRSGIDYVSGLEEEGDTKMTTRSIRKMMEKVFNEPSITEDQLEAREEVTEAIASMSSTGLMAKRGSE